MKIYIICCKNCDDDSILFIDRVVNSEKVAQSIITNMSQDCQKMGYDFYYDYEEHYIL